MGGGDDAHVHLDRRVTADPVELPVGQHPQQPGLRLGGHVADFVEKQGAAVRLLEAAGAAGGRPGEGALLVAEQFRLDQIVGDRRHVQGDKGVFGARAVAVQGPGHQLLAGAGLAVDQHGDIGVGQPADGAEHLLHGRCLADDVGVFQRRPVFRRMAA